MPNDTYWAIIANNNGQGCVLAYGGGATLRHEIGSSPSIRTLLSKKRGLCSVASYPTKWRDHSA